MINWKFWKKKAKCEFCGLDMVDEKTMTCIVNEITLNDDMVYKRDSTYYDDGDRCHDCNIVNEKGNFHHKNCDVEKCPKCGEQLLGCGHW